MLSTKSKGKEYILRSEEKTGKQKKGIIKDALILKTMEFILADLKKMGFPIIKSIMGIIKTIIYFLSGIVGAIILVAINYAGWIKIIKKVAKYPFFRDATDDFGICFGYFIGFVISIVWIVVKISTVPSLIVPLIITNTLGFGAYIQDYIHKKIGDARKALIEEKDKKVRGI